MAFVELQRLVEAEVQQFVLPGDRYFGFDGQAFQFVQIEAGQGFACRQQAGLRLQGDDGLWVGWGRRASKVRRVDGQFVQAPGFFLGQGGSRFSRFQRHVQAEVEAFGSRLGFQFAQVPVVVGNQQFALDSRGHRGFGQLQRRVQAEVEAFGSRLGFQFAQVPVVVGNQQFALDSRGHRGFGQLQRRVQAEVEAFGSRLVFQLAQAPVVVGDQQLALGDRHFGGRGRFERCLQVKAVLRQFEVGGLGHDGFRLIFRVQVLVQFRLFGGQHFDFLQRIGQGRRGFFLFHAVKDGRLLLQRIPQGGEAFLGHVEDQVALGGMILGQAFEVVLDAGNGVGQGVQALPVGHGLARQQLFEDVAVAGFQQGGGARQRDHRHAAAGLGQQLRHTGQVLVVPLRSDELDDGVLGLLQAIARLLDHQLVDLRHVGGGQMVFFRRALLRRADHAGQGGFDVEQCTGHIHQHRIAGITLPQGEAVDDVDLVKDHPARLAEAEHRQRVGDLLERRQQGIQFGDAGAVAAHEQVEAVLDPHQLFTEGGDHRAHGVAVGTGETGTLLVHHRGVGQGLVEAIAFFQGADARRLGRGLGDIEQQILHQLFRGRLVETVGALVEQALEFLVDLAQQVAHRGTIDHGTIGQAFHQAGGDLPERAERRVLAEGFETREDSRHVAQVGGQVLVADHAHQGGLQHLPQFAQQHRQVGGPHARQGVHGQRRQHAGKVRSEQAGFREQVVAAGSAQVVQQRQQDHWQVAAGTLDAVQVGRQLQDGLHQHFLGFAAVGRTAFHQGLGKALHFFGEQGRAIELDHLQRALDLMDIGQAETHARRVLGVLDEVLQGLPRLLQGFRDFALDPLEGDVVVPISHSRLLSLPGECQNLFIGHRIEIRVLPPHHFADTQHHQASRRQALGQAVEDFPAPPTAEVDQQVLTEDYVHAGYWRLRQFQHIEPCAAHPCGQARHYLVTAIVLDLEITLDERRFQLFQASCAIAALAGLGQGAEADVGAGHAEVVRSFCTAEGLGCQHGQGIRFFAAGATHAPDFQGPGKACLDTPPQVIGEQLEGRRVTEETGFLDSQPIQQGRPLHRATRSIGDLAVVAGVVLHPQFTHARAEIGLEEGAALVADHHTGALLQQLPPVMEFRCRHVGQGFQGPDAAWLHAVVPLIHGRRAAASGRGASPAQAMSCASGSLKPETDLRISLAIFARLPMLFAVAVVPAEVCEVISWITFMVLEIWPAEDAC
ncbi:hypothetical protein D9M71_78600 [compost metagenome]